MFLIVITSPLLLMIIVAFVRQPNFLWVLPYSTLWISNRTLWIQSGMICFSWINSLSAASEVGHVHAYQKKAYYKTCHIIIGKNRIEGRHNSKRPSPDSLASWSSQSTQNYKYVICTSFIYIKQHRCAPWSGSHRSPFYLRNWIPFFKSSLVFQSSKFGNITWKMLKAILSKIECLTFQISLYCSNIFVTRKF